MSSSSRGRFSIEKGLCTDRIRQQLAMALASYYFATSVVPQGCPNVQSFNDGLGYGPCNGSSGVKYGPQSKYWAAVYFAQDYCGRGITVTYGDNSINLIVMDSCPSCGKDNNIDMSLEALIELTGSAEKACAINTVSPSITWKFDSYPTVSCV